MEKNGIICAQLPAAYEIQTTSYCNGRCIICPHRDVVTSPEHMSQALFEKIIDEIRDLSSDGKGVLLIPYLNGEPFLDPHICCRLDLIRERLPHCRLELSTNLSVLSDDILNAIIRNKVNDFRISCFGWAKSYEQSMPGLRFSRFCEHLRRLLDRMSAEGMLQTVSLTVVQHPFIRLSDIEELRSLANREGISLNLWGALDRAGNVASFRNDIQVSKEDELAKRYSCAQRRHLERMHIFADGTVVLCCQDWRRDVVLGNAASSSLRSIWNNQAYQHVRAAIDEAGLPYPELCKKCKILLEGAKW